MVARSTLKVRAMVLWLSTLSQPLQRFLTLVGGRLGLAAALDAVPAGSFAALANARKDDLLSILQRSGWIMSGLRASANDQRSLSHGEIAACRNHRFSVHD
jgi:hypothetical protein